MKTGKGPSTRKSLSLILVDSDRPSFSMDREGPMKSSEIIFEVIDSPEGGYEARALSASIFTEAEALPELEETVRDAVRCHFDEGQAPSVIRLV
jgi:dephospho-CoA kinase